MISNSMDHVPLDTGSHDLDPGPQEKSIIEIILRFFWKRLYFTGGQVKKHLLWIFKVEYIASKVEHHEFNLDNQMLIIRLQSRKNNIQRHDGRLYGWSR